MFGSKITRYRRKLLLRGSCALGIGKATPHPWTVLLCDDRVSHNDDEGTGCSRCGARAFLSAGVHDHEYNVSETGGRGGRRAKLRAKEGKAPSLRPAAKPRS